MFADKNIMKGHAHNLENICKKIRKHEKINVSNLYLLKLKLNPNFQPQSYSNKCKQTSYPPKTESHFAHPQGHENNVVKRLILTKTTR